MRFRFLATGAIALSVLVAPLSADHKRPSHHRHQQKSTGQQILGFALRTLPYLMQSNQNSYSRYSYSTFPSYSYGYSRSYSFGGFCPPTYGYRSYSYSTNPYGTFYQPQPRINVYLPPVYAPAETMYGPQPLKQFMGLDRNFGLGPLTTPSAPLLNPGATVAKPVVPKKPVRVSNPATVERAMKLVNFGDNLFKEGKYHEALQQYKRAAGIAPDLATIHMRQGFALIGVVKYDLAAAAFKRAMTLDPSSATSGFKLDSLYDGAKLAKTTHLETLAESAFDDTDDPDKLFALGMFLHFDGSPDRAKKFFERAAELSRPDDAHVLPFLGESREIPVAKDGGFET